MNLSLRKKEGNPFSEKKMSARKKASLIVLCGLLGFSAYLWLPFRGTELFPIVEVYGANMTPAALAYNSLSAFIPQVSLSNWVPELDILELFDSLHFENFNGALSSEEGTLYVTGETLSKQGWSVYLKNIRIWLVTPDGTVRDIFTLKGELTINLNGW